MKPEKETQTHTWIKSDRHTPRSASIIGIHQTIDITWPIGPSKQGLLGICHDGGGGGLASRTLI